MRSIYIRLSSLPSGWPAIAFLKLDRTRFVIFLNRQP